ncbi:enoyl-CoA hydratase-related protein [Paenibacillus thiaminolyticus]|uniref:Enoyl-CoA hydratase n=1 Tax=Paenibacillus thiaminolyticus TaxID=49283 RepID=A0AAP9DX51_PANTH|nr:enoyl-CoA hydratase-related protein [Paenibacillus thiaminolyticus]MCY9535200.1 enoyl-CoA hydratase-related protein [Paenibacillus thiaminolyticus]MCY9602461.1 enoyl-CoA hydratase-related protein [Paenibacillus thiaminolyticus]MCY9606113.1 enoyl-CoA hydratase-related protein [Paenibacillus thiaminolyticus]MCY9612498.1 enoyl-CoA hydratase-related protein [Paenibacillus thiaminolyticus]MCY9620873.1 enoyl-CoA hydratase-related protein [Paenibacillus thiaminolyticus]
MTTKLGNVVTVSSAGAVGVLALNRPDVLNALNRELMQELVAELERMDRDDAVKAIVITGNDQAFAAGADIKEMADESAVSLLLKRQFDVWDRIGGIEKPIIAAVSGHVLGGGCELMMNCDLVVASDTARFGQPEIRLGVMPGAGGTQRLTRAVGLRKAMELLLTGDTMPAEEALRCGLINKVAPVELYLQEALKLAHRIAAQPPLAVRLIKQAVRKAEDLPLAEGLDYERQCFYLLFASEDQKEGMGAFQEKRNPQFKGR